MSQKTILLAEDHDELRSLLRRVLEMSGYTVLEAGDGHAGLEASVSAGPIELLVADMSMPRLSGAGLARRLVELRPGLKVLFISIHALSDEDLADTCPGSSQFLPKPFTADELTKKVREMLHARPPTDA